MITSQGLVADRTTSVRQYCASHPRLRRPSRRLAADRLAWPMGCTGWRLQSKGRVVRGQPIRIRRGGGGGGDEGENGAAVPRCDAADQAPSPSPSTSLKKNTTANPRHQHLRHGFEVRCSDRAGTDLPIPSPFDKVLSTTDATRDGSRSLYLSNSCRPGMLSFPPPPPPMPPGPMCPALPDAWRCTTVSRRHPGRSTW